MGKHSVEEKKTSAAREALSWVFCISVAILVALLLRIFVFELVMVQGESMEHTLHNGQTVFVEKVSRNFGNLSRRQIVIVKYPEREGAFVKRIVGLPGDTIEVKEGALYVNDVRQDEPYIAEPYILQDFARVTVPEDCYFVMGDNRNYSADSRFAPVGLVDEDDILGKVLGVILPGKDPDSNYPDSRVRDFHRIGSVS